MKLTQRHLKKILDYNPLTGIFLWKISKPGINKSAAGYTKESGYYLIVINYKHYYAHRLAWFYMTGKWPKQIDHVNHNRSDNSWNNLREVSQSVNNRNMSRAKNNTSGYTGVSWSKDRKRWVAQIKINGRNISLGRFLNIDDAIAARKQAEIAYEFHENHGMV